MSVPSEIVEFIKQSLLPEISEIKTEIVGLRSEIKVIKGRLDLMDKRFDEVDKRFDQMHEQMRDMKDEIREIRSYVWTGGLNAAHGIVAESQAQYRTKRES